MAPFQIPNFLKFKHNFPLHVLVQEVGPSSSSLPQSDDNPSILFDTIGKTPSKKILKTKKI
jgi:hypothetical protein